jgi:hypothetical protein
MVFAFRDLLNDENHHIRNLRDPRERRVKRGHDPPRFIHGNVPRAQDLRESFLT